MTDNPAEVWIMHTPEMGIVGVWTSDDHAKKTAQALFERELVWYRTSNGFQALQDELAPATSSIVVVERHNIWAEPVDPYAARPSSPREPAATPPTTGDLTNP